MKRIMLALILIGVSITAGGCTFYSTAKHWNKLVDIDGSPVYYKTATKIGLKLLVVIPLLGNLGIDGLVSDLTLEISNEGGNRVRLVQGTTENYWYGWPPITWIVTPVISEVSAEYRPSWEQMAKDREEDRKNAAK